MSAVLNMLSKSTIRECINLVISSEGGYSNHPNDKGGETYFGITKPFAESIGIKFPPTKKDAIKAYDLIGRKHGVFYLDAATAYFILDGGVLFGIQRFIMWFQYAINVTGGFDLKRDGIIGKKTLSAYEKCDKDQVIMLLHRRVINHHRAVVTRDFRQAVFIRGWLKRAEKRLKGYMELKNSIGKGTCDE